MACVLLGILLCAGCNREERAWNAAESEATIQAYEGFLASYPDTTHAEQCRKRIETLAWKQTDETRTVKEYAEFLGQYPRSEYLEEALTRMEGLATNDDKPAQSLEDFRGFLARFPEDQTLKGAESQIEKMKWKLARKDGGVESLEAYIADYPEGANVADAQKEIERITWEKTRKGGSEGDFAAYLAKYPEGAFAVEARADLGGLKENRLFADFDQKILKFINGVSTLIDKSPIKTIDGKGREEISFSIGILSGGFTIVGGRRAPDPGSVLVYSDPKQRFRISGQIGNDPGTLLTYRGSTFSDGVRIGFASGEVFERKGDGWRYIWDRAATRDGSRQ